MRWSLLGSTDLYLFRSPLILDCDPAESERPPQIPWHACENVSCILTREGIPWLIFAPSAVLYKLHERLLVQAAQANEVRRSAHAQGMRDHR
jgi:hypothetical protein